MFITQVHPDKGQKGLEPSPSSPQKNQELGCGFGRRGTVLPMASSSILNQGLKSPVNGRQQSWKLPFLLPRYLAGSGCLTHLG